MYRNFFFFFIYKVNRQIIFFFINFTLFSLFLVKELLQFTKNVFVHLNLTAFFCGKTLYFSQNRRKKNKNGDCLLPRLKKILKITDIQKKKKTFVDAFERICLKKQRKIYLRVGDFKNNLFKL